LEQAAKKKRVERFAEPAIADIVVVDRLEQSAFAGGAIRSRAIEPDSSAIPNQRFPVVRIKFEAGVGILAIGEIAAVSLDGDTERNIRAVIESILARFPQPCVTMT
jgi:hypothetical protein